MPGRTISPFNGGPLIFRDGQAAARNFKISSQVSGVWRNTALIPKPKFLFFVEFVVPDTAPDFGLFDSISDRDKLSDTREGIVFQVKQIDKPKFNIRTETMVQYNKKRVVQTRIDYQPFTINFHDDVGDKVLRFWERYYEFYYGDGQHTQSIDWQEDKVANEFIEGGGDVGWGYKGRFNGSGGANNMHFFESIDIYEFYGGEFTRIRFIHPKISNLDHDANDYADGSSGQSIRMTFDYEGVIYNLDRQPLTPELVNKFGFLSEYANIDGSQPAELSSILDSGKDVINNPSVDLSSNEIPNTGRDQLRQAVRQASATQTFAGISALSGQDFNFGTNAFTGSGNNNIDLVNLVSLNDGTPSPDLIQKQTGIKNQTDNFGTVRPAATNPIQNIRTAPNAGIDGARVSSAASTLSTDNQSREISIGNGQSRLVDARTQADFSRTLGTTAVLGQSEGLITEVANPITGTNPTSNGSSFVDQFGDGSYSLTNRGAAVSNAVRSKESVLGTRHDTITWTSDRVKVDPIRRGLNAERDTEFNE